MGNQKYWKLVDRYLEEFIYPDPVIKERYERYKDEGGFDEFFYAYDEFYVICDLMGWTYYELMDWVEENLDRINELYEEVYGPEYKNVYRSNKDVFYDQEAKDIEKRSK